MRTKLGSGLNKKSFVESSLVRVIIVISFLLLPDVPYAYEKCIDLFSNVIEAVDIEYKRLMSETPSDTLVGRQKIATGVHDLLKRALYPLVKRINDLGMNFSKQQIDLILKNYEEKYPIESTALVSYADGFYPVIVSKSQYSEIISQSVRGNTVGGNFSFYRYDQQPEIGLRKNQKVLWVEPNEDAVKDFGLFHALLSTTITPVGSYGENFSQNLLRTTRIMMDLVAKDPKLREISEQIYNSNQALLNTEATRSKHQRNEYATPGLTPLSGALEGIVSFHQLISTVLAEKISGIESGQEALEAIVKKGANEKLGLTAELVSRLTIGVVAPMTMGGFYFKKPFVRNAEGKLELSKEITNLLSRFSKKIVEAGARKGRCPMAGLFSRKSAISNNLQIPNANKEENLKVEIQEKAGLQLLADAYLEVFNKVQNANKNK